MIQVPAEDEENPDRSTLAIDDVLCEHPRLDPIRQ
jgi:hypothetical protein